MADVEFLLNQDQGKNLFLRITREADDYIYDYDDGTFKAVPTDEQIPLVEDSGTYTVTLTLTNWDDGAYLVESFDTTYEAAHSVAREIDVRNGNTLEDDTRSDVQVDQDTGGLDNLTYVESDGTPVEGALVKVYRQADYGTASGTPIGITKTDTAGHWKKSIPVPSGDSYIVEFHMPNYFGPDTATLVL